MRHARTVAIAATIAISVMVVYQIVGFAAFNLDEVARVISESRP